MSRMHDLEAQQLDAPDDAALRLVLADALEQRGDPRGTLIQLHHALATATMRDERIRLRAAIRELLARELTELEVPGLELSWDLGFVRAATITGDVAALLPRLLAHPAARLLRELALAVDSNDVAAVVASIDARPRPSLLARVNVGRITDDCGAVTADGPDTVVAFATALARDPSLVVGLRDRASQAELEAALASHTHDEPGEDDLFRHFDQLAPMAGHGWWGLTFAIRDGCHDAVAELHRRFGKLMERILQGCSRRNVDPSTTYAKLYGGLKALAPYVDDVRFLATVLRGQWQWIDEYAITDGELGVSRGYLEQQDRDLHPFTRLDNYWQVQVARRPGDQDLRRFLVRLLLQEADRELFDADERDNAAARVHELLDQAHQLDPLAPALWRWRGRRARALGDLVESERCFARQAELEDRPEVAFDRALVAFTAGEEDRARTLAIVAAAGLPETRGAQLLASYLARNPAPLRVLLGSIDARPPGLGEWGRLEPAAGDLIRTGRHGSMVEWLIEHLPSFAAREAALCVPAAAYMLGWAEELRLHVVQERGTPEATQLADKLYRAAAALDPLGGEIHLHWAKLIRHDDGAGEVKKLEEGSSIMPDHLGILHRLAEVAHEARDYDRAIALFDRLWRLDCSRARETGQSAWSCAVEHLVGVYRERVHLALHGVAPDEPPPSPQTTRTPRHGPPMVAVSTTSAGSTRRSSTPSARSRSTTTTGKLTW